MKRIIAMSIITLSAVLFVHPFASSSGIAVAACATPDNCRRACHARFDRCIAGNGQNCRQKLAHCLRRCHNN